MIVVETFGVSTDTFKTNDVHIIKGSWWKNRLKSRFDYIKIPQEITGTTSKKPVLIAKFTGKF